MNERTARGDFSVAQFTRTLQRRMFYLLLYNEVITF